MSCNSLLHNATQCLVVEILKSLNYNSRYGDLNGFSKLKSLATFHEEEPHKRCFPTYIYSNHEVLIYEYFIDKYIVEIIKILARMGLDLKIVALEIQMVH